MVSQSREGLKKIDPPCESKTLTKAFATKWCRKATTAPRKIDSGCIRLCFFASASLTTRLATKLCRRAGNASKKSIPPVNQKPSRKLLRLNGVARQRTHRETSSLDASARVFSHQQPSRHVRRLNGVAQQGRPQKNRCPLWIKNPHESFCD